MKTWRNAKSACSSLIRDCRGVATIEFAMTVVLFIVMVFFVAEIARLAYISAVIDLAVSEAAKDGKNAPASDGGGYDARFRQGLLGNGGSLWGFLTRADAVSIRIRYANSVNDMISYGGSTDFHQQALARYQLIYHYHPMFFPLGSQWTNNLLNREVIFVQEYERSRFMQ